MSAVRVLPAGEAGWEDVRAVFGTRGECSRCFCQRYKMAPGESWASVGAEALASRLRAQPGGLIAYLDGEPAGWCAVEPRTAYPRLLLKTRVPWDGRDEDKGDAGVWAVTCFVTRTGCRRRGVSRALAREAIDHARRHGARAVEGYPMVTADALLGELHVGLGSVFAAAGFTEVARPSKRRAVMRIDFDPQEVPR